MQYPKPCFPIAIFALILLAATNTPEPSSLLLSALALPALGFAFRRKNAIVRLP